MAVEQSTPGLPISEDTTSPIIFVSKQAPQLTSEQQQRGAGAVEALWKELLKSGELLGSGDDLPDMRQIEKRLSRGSLRLKVKPQPA